MNVALTRAKFVLVIVGNGDTLSSNEIWGKLLNHLINKGSYYKLSKSEDMENKNFNDINAVLIEDNEQYEEKSETSKMGEGDDIDILAQEDHSYLFKNNEQKSNLMCLITKKAEMSEEQCVNSVFNLFDIANKIQK